MVTVLINNWWALAVRGVAAVAFGLIAILWPAITAAALVLLFAAYALIDGVFSLIAAQRAARRHGRSWPLLLEAVLDIVLAGFALVFPGVALIVFIYAIAIWALLTGAALLTAGLAMLRQHGDLLLILSGFLSIVLGVVLLLQPTAGVIALAWWLGIYALLFGITLVGAAFRLRGRGPA